MKLTDHECDFLTSAHCHVVMMLGNNTFGNLLDPFPFGRICFVVMVTRKGGESSWHLYLVCTLEVFHVHNSYQDQFTQPGWAEWFLCILPKFVFCVFICVSVICLYVPILLCFAGQLSHLPYSFWR